jgi:hypothetical protein
MGPHLVLDERLSAKALTGVDYSSNVGFRHVFPA